MSTRCYIGLKNNETGNVDYIYCHHDGYPQYVGETLTMNYNTIESVKALIELGDISSIGPSVKETDAYHRDHGEDYDEVKASSINEEEYVNKSPFVSYIYLGTVKDDGKGISWACYDGETRTELS